MGNDSHNKSLQFATLAYDRTKQKWLNKSTIRRGNNTYMLYVCMCVYVVCGVEANKICNVFFYMQRYL